MTQTQFVPVGDPRSRLDDDRRSRDRDRLAAGAVVDVLVVGGGITGAGVALDAASRGLSVALVERGDLGSGTSGWSSKLVHGGLRYLAHGQVGVAWESAVERGHLMSAIAPHLIRPLPQLVPRLRGARLDATVTHAGFLAGDALRMGARTPRGTLPRTRRVSAAEARRWAPALDRSRLVGGVLGWDGQVEDDVRLVLAVARTAAAYDTAVLTRTRVLALGHDGAEVVDADGGTYRIRARAVVNATGVWAGTLDPAVQLTPSRGTHLVLRAITLANPRAALTVPVPGERGRYVFALPQPDGLVYLGLTDVPVHGAIPDVPHATEDEIEWLLAALSPSLAQPLTRSDVVGTYAGLRPLLAGSAAVADAAGGSPGSSDGASAAGALPVAAAPVSGADLSRRHAVRQTGSLITVTGGKLTTYRRMAADVVDLLTSVPCRTATLPLVGAGPLHRVAGVPDRLVRRYGAEASLVWGLAADNPSLAAPVSAGLPVLGVELAFGLAWEGAASVDDLLDRRVRLGFVPADRARAEPAAQEMVESMTAREGS